MTMLTWVVFFAVLMGVVAFVAGLVNAVRLLRPSREGAVPVGTQLGAVLLVGIGGALVGTAMVTAALVKERDVEVHQLQSAVNQLEAKVRLYETGLTRLERTVEAARGSRASTDRITAEIRQEIAELRQRRASVP